MDILYSESQSFFFFFGVFFSFLNGESVNMGNIKCKTFSLYSPVNSTECRVGWRDTLCTKHYIE